MLLAPRRPVRTLTLAILGTLALLGAWSRPSQAEKAADCTNQTTALCQKVERCSGGFETNGTCQWIYTVTYAYWRY